MKVTLNLTTLIEHSLSADDYVFMFLIHKQEYDVYSSSAIVPEFEELKLSGYVEGDISELRTIRLTEKGNLLMGLEKDNSIEAFTKQYQRLFANTKDGGMGDDLNVINMMRWFKSTYDYDNETILMATIRYINENRRNRFSYMLDAGKFIRKFDHMGDPSSKLAAFCATIDSDDNSTDTDYSTNNFRI